jgi:hypothetical protein
MLFTQKIKLWSKLPIERSSEQVLKLINTMKNSKQLVALVKSLRIRDNCLPGLFSRNNTNMARLAKTFPFVEHIETHASGLEEFYKELIYDA